MKKKTLIILSIIFIILLGIGFYFFSNQSTYKVIINNNTNKEISGLQISYNNNKNISIPSIKAGDSEEVNVKSNENGSLFMYYTDILGDSHKEILAGYFQQGAQGKIVVNITSVNTWGIYGMEIAAPEAENILNNQ